jgi:hypothetical protein
MNPCQKLRVQAQLNWTKEELADLQTRKISLGEQTKDTEFVFTLLLKEIIPTLPKTYREQANALFEDYTRMQEAWYAETRKLVDALREPVAVTNEP